MYQVVNNLSHQAGAHALRAGVDFLYNDDRITYPRAARGAYTFSSLANFLSGTYNNAGFTQTFGESVVDQGERERWHLRAGRVARQLEPDAESRPALRPAVPADNQHRHEQPLAACRLRVDAVCRAPHDRARQRRTLLRSRAAARAGERRALGRQHHRSRKPAADWRQPVADAGRGAGLSEHPSRRRALRHPRQFDDDGSEHAERVLDTGECRGRTAARQQEYRQRRLSVRARPGPDHVGESECAVVRGVGNEQRVPSQSRLRQQQPVLPGGRLQLSRAARRRSSSVRPPGATTA